MHPDIWGRATVVKKQVGGEKGVGRFKFNLCGYDGTEKNEGKKNERKRGTGGAGG